MNTSSDLAPAEAPEEFGSGKAVACMILGLSFLVGAPGNLLVIWTILRHIKQRSHTVVLVLHLAVADMLVIITLPLWIYSLLHTWVFGALLCKGLVYMIYVCMFSSIIFITIMSVERFLAICHPFMMRGWNSHSAMSKFLVFVWVVSFLLGLPAILNQTVDERDGVQQCSLKEFNSTNQAIVFLCLETLLGFVLPIIILSICYCLVVAQLKKMSFSSKQKSMVLVQAVVIAFIFCWLPYHIINIINCFCILSSDTDYECVPESIVLCSGALVFISSSVNPVLYAFFARNFRGSLDGTRLVKLFQEMVTYTNKLRERAIQHQAGQRAANTQTEQNALC
ncbi:leukotriene B4 receptor 1-like [Menidia menidia]